MAAPSPDEKERRRAQILAYINRELDAGKNPNAVLASLEAKNMPRQTAIKLIDHVLKRRKAQPAAPKPAAPTPSEDEYTKFVEVLVSQGKSQKEIVDRLLARGLDQDTALTLVTEISKKHRTQTAAFQALNVKLDQPERLSAQETRHWGPFIAGKFVVGWEEKEIIDALVAEGLSRDHAIDLVLNEKSKIEAETAEPSERSKKERSSAGLRNILIGGALFIGGIIVTVATYTMADVGGTYILCYGPIIFGFILAVRGLIEYFT
jgi:hypothetical protein